MPLDAISDAIQCPKDTRIINVLSLNLAYSPLNSAYISLISEVTLPRTVNASPPVAQKRVIFVSSLYYILGTGLFSLSLVLLHICKSPVFEKKAGAALALLLSTELARQCTVQCCRAPTASITNHDLE